MSVEFRIPGLGENIDSADVGQVLVKEGDTIAAGKAVLELETEKAVFEVECPHAGKISKIHVKPGDTVSVGTLVLTVEGEAAQPASESPKPAPASNAPAAKGNAQAKDKSPRTATNGAPPKAVEAEKASTAVAEAPPRPTPAPMAPERLPEDRFPAPAAPATRRLARQLGVDLFQVKGMGPGGRITQEDVRAFVKRHMQAGGPPASSKGFSPPPLPDFSEYGPIERVRMSKLNATAATNLNLAWSTIPHVTQHDLADVTDLEAARRRFTSDPKYKGPKVTMTVLAVKACVAALKSFPHVNASYDAAGLEVIHKHFYNIGVAVDTEHGLLVPVIKNADQKSVLQIAQEVTDLADRARARKLDVASMKGGTFTITNLGGIGGIGFTPIVNWPEVAILGMSRSYEQLQLVDGKAESRLMLPLSLSYDHRVINGADAARFVRKLCELFSDPIHLLVEV